MSALLTSMVYDLFQRILATKRVSALTGGTKKVDSIVITAGGSGYLVAPTVVFSSGAATGTAVISGGVVVSVTITAMGSYTIAPTVSFTPVSGGSGAAGTVITSPTSLDAIITTSLTAGEFMVLLDVNNSVMPYHLVAGTDAEVSPAVIRPDDYNAGTNAKVWKLIEWFGAGTVFSNYSTKVIQNTTTPTSMVPTSAVGTNVVAANTLLPGSRVKVTVAGYATVDAGGAAAFIKCAAGGTNHTAYDFVAPAAGSATIFFQYIWEFVFHSIGASGVYYWISRGTYQDGSGATGHALRGSSGSATLDTTAAITFDPQTEWLVADTDNVWTVTQCQVEVTI